LEEVPLTHFELGADQDGRVRLAKLVMLLGLAASTTEADRKVKEGAVRLDGEVVKQSHITLQTLKMRMTVRVGKRAKMAVLE
jgi:tyrosyl-tRNA synthetase